MPLKRKHGINDCLSRCVGYLLGNEPQRVPFFIAHRDWRRRLTRYFHRRGLEIYPVKFRYGLLSNRRKLYMVQGLSPRGMHHCVIYRGRKPYSDPSLYGGFLKGRPLFVWKVEKIKKRK